MKINWSLVTDNVAVHCNTEGKANELFRQNKLRGGSVLISTYYNHNYKEETCYCFSDSDITGFASTDWCKQYDYKIIEFNDLLISENNNQIKNTLAILNLNKGEIVDIKGYSSNPCKITEDFQLINKWNTNVSSSWLIKMIECRVIYTKYIPKQMTKEEIEKELGYRIEIV